MTDRPILFSAPMVRALLAGTKTQTRRAVRPQPDAAQAGFIGDTGLCGRFTPDDAKLGRLAKSIPCPYGVPGDRLWVREAFSGARAYETRGYPLREWGNKIFYWADGNPRSGDWTKPRPSIHMPRCLSRITLEVVSVRVERLQDISEADAIAEGIQLIGGRYTFNGGLHESRTAVESYRALWEQINGAGSWDANPWVWVVEFKRC